MDNPGKGVFVFYDNPGSPFLDFSSSTTVTSQALPAEPESFFRADVAGNGAMTFKDASGMGRHETALTVVQPVLVRLEILDVQGFIDCATPANRCDVDWEIDAQLQFSNDDISVGWPGSDCTTDPFTVYIDGDWGNTTSDSFIIPALSGTGSQACFVFSTSINTFFGLGADGAELHLYKFEGVNESDGPFQGS